MHEDAITTLPEAPPVSEMVQVLEAQSGLYTLLGRCLEGEVDAALLGILRGALGEVIGELGLELGADVMNAPERQVLDTLAEEYASLFVAPGAVSPFRSVFESGRLFQTQADIAAAAYREAGFAFQSIHSGEFADHIGVMLAFVGRLLNLEADALRAGDADAAAAWRARRARVPDCASLAPGRWDGAAAPTPAPGTTSTARSSISSSRRCGTTPAPSPTSRP